MKKFVSLFAILLICFSISACSSENTDSEEKEINNTESEDNNIETDEINSTKKQFNFSLEEFVQTFNDAVQDIENDEKIESPSLNHINTDNIGDFKYDENKDIYTKELKTESDDSGGVFTLTAWYDNDQNFNGLNLMTSGSDNIESEIGLYNTFAVFHAIGIDIGHLNDLLESDQDMLDVDEGDYFVHLAKIPDTAVVVKIEPK
ncbi:hypothetical protein [Bacillus halotolerans]|uniref:hypothetical protein n=1 Tax=Bacillus halotolerans TaxID=260554 RepID=UPI002DBD949C|nr:hypothetical protein [Bacillus halotolerans]MEC1648931.1 hypothetical protein [Bacillus halotolerans]